MNDFGSNPTAPTGQARGKKEVVSHGIITITLPNGNKLDGYILLSEVNLARLGVKPDAVKALVDGQRTGQQSATLMLQFGQKDKAVAEQCDISFA